jgi:hypothetical protein
MSDRYMEPAIGTTISRRPVCRSEPRRDSAWDGSIRRFASRRRHYYYRGMPAPIEGGSQETFDLVMSISGGPRNVEAQGPGTKKTLGPKEI